MDDGAVGVSHSWVRLLHFSRLNLHPIMTMIVIAARCALNPRPVVLVFERVSLLLRSMSIVVLEITMKRTIQQTSAPAAPSKLLQQTPPLIFSKHNNVRLHSTFYQRPWIETTKIAQQNLNR